MAPQMLLKHKCVLLSFGGCLYDSSEGAAKCFSLFKDHFSFLGFIHYNHFSLILLHGGSHGRPDRIPRPKPRTAAGADGGIPRRSAASSSATPEGQRFEREARREGRSPLPWPEPISWTRRTFPWSGQRLQAAAEPQPSSQLVPPAFFTAPLIAASFQALAAGRWRRVRQSPQGKS